MKTHLDLFSGIGGFALAAKWAGFTTIGFCEYEDFPRRVLSARFPGVPIHGDIRELNGEQYRGVSLITGGFPCQPFSVAGQQKGATDDRYLWPEMLRVIAQAQPDWVVAENVTGLITLALDQVLTDLESEGYACGTVVLPACAVNAPHRRDRVWIIGYTDRNRESDMPVDAKAPGVQDVGNPGSKHFQRNNPEKGGGDGLEMGRHFLDRCQRHEEKHMLVRPSEDVADSRSTGRKEQHSPTDSERPGHSAWCPAPGRTDWWEVEPPVGRVVDGLPGRVDRLKGLGNAIVPQVAYEILRLLTDK